MNAEDRTKELLAIRSELKELTEDFELFKMEVKKNKDDYITLLQKQVDRLEKMINYYRTN